MTDRPIIFSAPMVRALLAGDKTMTRRPLYLDRVAKNGIVPNSMTFLEEHKPPVPKFNHYWALSPWHRAQPGDRLWVRENFHPWKGSASGKTIVYVADDEWIDWGSGQRFKDKVQWCSPVTPSIHMPRHASRITLVVTATKIERLQDISVLDVRAEGCEVRQFWLFGADGPERQKIGARVFGNLWEEIHGRESWEANPEVVALKFRVIFANIDSDTARAAA